MSRIITQELRKIAASNGGVLQPEHVLEAATPEDAPLHKYFEWDDTEAARQYRLTQAHQLIRVAVTVVESGDRQIRTRCFVSLTTDRELGGGYRETATVLADNLKRAQLLADARQAMALFRKKFETLHELADVFAAMDSLAA